MSGRAWWSAPSPGLQEAFARCSPLPSVSPVCGRGGADPPMCVCARCRGYRPRLGAGTKRPVTSSSKQNSPPGAVRPIVPAGVGEGALGGAVPIRTLGCPHCLYIPAVGTRAAWARTARLRARLPSWSAEESKGFRGPRPGSSGAHPGSLGPKPGRLPPLFHVLYKG